MDLEKIENKKLMDQCCIIREIEAGLNNNHTVARAFNELRNELKEVPFIKLKEKYDGISSLKNFLNEMENTKRKPLIRKYYKKLCKAAEKEYGTNNLNESTIKKFIKNNDLTTINGYKKDLDKNKKYLISGIAITTLAGILGISIISKHNGNKPDGNKLKTETITTETPIAEPVPNPPGLEENDTIYNDAKNIDYSDSEFHDKLLNNFKKLYLRESGKNNLSPDDISLNPNRRTSYLFQVKIGDEYRYVSHGETPDDTKEYLVNTFEDSNVEILRDNNDNYRLVTIYYAEKDEKGKLVPKKIKNQFGKMTDQETETVAYINGELVKIYDGNNPQKLISEPNSITFDVNLEKMANVFNNSFKGPSDNALNLNSYLSSFKDFLHSKRVVTPDAKQKSEHVTPDDYEQGE